MFDFPGKQPNEKVLLVIRKHFIVYLRITIIFLVTSIVPVSIFLLIWMNKFPMASGGNIGIMGFLGAGLYILYSLAVYLIAWLNEEFDLFILTNQRLIDITQVSFLKRTVATTPLNQIQDTTSDIQEVLGTLLNYGNIDVQTAAGFASNFTIDYIADPAMVARSILSMAQKSKSLSANLGATNISTPDNTEKVTLVDNDKIDVA